MSISLMKFAISIINFLSLDISKILFLTMYAVHLKEPEMKNIFQNEPNDADLDDDGYVTADEEISDVFYDAKQDIDSDSDSNISGYETAEEETLDDFQDPHQYGLWNPVTKTLAFWPENSIIGRLDRIPCRSKSPEINHFKGGNLEEYYDEEYTLRHIENSAPRRKHRIEMKFNTRINKNERFT